MYESSIIFLWIGSLVLLICISAAISKLTRQRCVSFRMLTKDERGSVSIQFVLLLPLMVGAFLLVIETTNFLIATMGLRAAAAATVRSAIVWLPAEIPGDHGGHLRLSRVRDAAVRNWMPYLPGHFDYLPLDNLPPGRGGFKAEHLVDSVLGQQLGSPKRRFLENQLALAETIEIDLVIGESFDPLSRQSVLASLDGRTIARYRRSDRGPSFDSEVRVKVTAIIPFKTALIGRLFGSQPWGQSAVYGREITVEFALPLEGAQGPDQKIGIDHFYERSTFLVFQ